MTVVLDASVVVGALIDSGEVGVWAEDVLRDPSLTAPHHLLVEAANILRRAVVSGDVSPDIASLAHGDLLDLRVELVPYPPLAHRVWELRENVTAYDACYVALAERLDAPLATLDRRLARATGPRCEFVLPS